MDEELEVSPRLIFLNQLEDRLLYDPKGQTLSILLSAARSVVVYTWKRPTAIPVILWYNKLLTYYRIARITENITYHIDEERAQDRFAAVWFPIMTLLASCQHALFDI